MPKAASGENPIPPKGSLDVSKLFSVQGKNALVTGGGSGIGAMITCTLVQNGVRVFIASRKDTSSYAKELTEMGPGTCISISGIDLGKLEDVSRLKESVAQHLGAKEGLHILINNSGTNYNAPIESHDMKQFEKVIKLNLTSVFATVQVFHDLMNKAATKGDPARVINVSSIHGIRPPPFSTYAYSSSKAGVVMLSRHLATDLAPEILVNSIAPGSFPSRMMRATLDAVGGQESFGEQATLTKRIGCIDDAGGAVIYLCSRAGANVTGTTLVVDSGSSYKSSL